MELSKALDECSNSQLKELVSQLFGQLPEEKQIAALRSLRSRKDSDTAAPKKSNASKKKEFNITKFRQRHIAFQIQYDGSQLYGFASQDDHVDTVEKHFFQALQRLNLIADRRSCRYSRCGRTDKGVSALGQIVALWVRSSIPLIQGDIDPCSESSVLDEMDYCGMLNRCLPPTVRVLGWTAVSDGFSARFSCAHRRYRYFFVRRNLDLDRMQEACQLLLGRHDFRNLCKLDVANVSNFVRDIYSARILPFAAISRSTDAPSSPAEEVYYLEIAGIAFLWHMVRCIMAVLFLVGEGREDPTIISELLDIERNPAKPAYSMAPDLPLVLHECAFEHLRLEHRARSLLDLQTHFETQRAQAAVVVAQMQNALEALQDVTVRGEEVRSMCQERKEKREKGQQRLRSRGIQLPTAPSSSSSTSASAAVVEEEVGDEPAAKRARVDADSMCIDVNKAEMTWAEARILLGATARASADQQSKQGPYVPLLQRKKEESLEERVAALAGVRKERLARHQQLQAEADLAESTTAMAAAAECELDEDTGMDDEAAVVNGTQAFFAQMRSQGSLSLLAKQNNTSSST